METLMKKTGIVFMVILATLAFVPKGAKANPGISVSFQQFYDELSPYGYWVNDPQYGYVWVPDVEPGFQPYATNGHWVMTSYGNTWVSNYDWGWAPFHYGRWHYSNRFGWSWMPDYEWGPAWVSWRNGGGYYGWAPLGPGMSVHVSVNLPLNHWTFVPQRYLLHTYAHRYYAPRVNMVNVYRQTTIINNTYVHNNRTYVSGPSRRDIQAITRRQVPVHQVAEMNKPGRGRVDGSSVSMYRPSIDRNSTTARPGRIADANTVSRQNNVATSSRTPQGSGTGNRSNSGSSSVLQRASSNGATSGNSNSSRATAQKNGIENSASTSRSRATPAATNQQQSAARRTTNVSAQQPASTARQVAKPASSEATGKPSSNTGNAANRSANARVGGNTANSGTRGSRSNESMRTTTPGSSTSQRVGGNQSSSGSRQQASTVRQKTTRG